MTWAEFQIRSFSLNRVRKWQMFLTREIAYEVHTTRYLWGKKKPPRKDQYWDIEGKGNALQKKKEEALKRALEQYRNGTA